MEIRTLSKYVLVKTLEENIRINKVRVDSLRTKTVNQETDKPETSMTEKNALRL